MLIPTTRYRDCDAALAFITDVLGLQVHAVYRAEDGEIQHAQVKLGSGIMMFGPGSVASEGGSGTPVPDTSIEVDDVDVVYQRAKRAGGKIELRSRIAL